MAALERPQRAHAGRNIARLLDQDEVADEFYQTAYGGFGEEEEDNEYEVRSNKCALSNPLSQCNNIEHP